MESKRWREEKERRRVITNRRTVLRREVENVVKSKRRVESVTLRRIR